MAAWRYEISPSRVNKRNFVSPRGHVISSKQYHRKVLLGSFHSNSHTIEFHLQTKKLEAPYMAH